MAEMLSDFGHLIGLNGSTQVAVMPTYSTVAVGTIVQYVGATDANYTNGYFYKATASGWEVVDVQGEDTDKADKVASATAGNLAGLNASGNLTDAGWSADKTISNATGNPISISGLKSNQLAINPIITLEPIQAGSGDPSPSNIRAISGYDKIEVLSCGINIWDEEWEVGSIDYSTGEPIAYPNEIRTKDFISIIPSATYFIYKGSGGSSQYYFYDQNKHFIGSDQYTSNTVLSVPSNAHFMKFRCGDAYGTSYKNDISINYPSNISTYQPCNKTTDLSLQIGQTVYGGTLDVEKGILTVDRGYYVITGDEAYYAWTDAGSFKYTATTLFLPNANVWEQHITTNLYPNITQGNYPAVQLDNSCSVRICYPANDPITIEELKAIFVQTNMQIVYPLATPYTIQLTPHEISLLKDYAYVSTNGTNMSFSYKNGEMASLGDVAQLGQTVNEFGNILKTGTRYQFNLNSAWKGTAEIYVFGKLALLNLNCYKSDESSYSVGEYEIGSLPSELTTSVVQVFIGAQLSSSYQLLTSNCRIVIRGDNNPNVLLTVPESAFMFQAACTYWIV